MMMQRTSEGATENDDGFLPSIVTGESMNADEAMGRQISGAEGESTIPLHRDLIDQGRVDDSRSTPVELTDDYSDQPDVESLPEDSTTLNSVSGLLLSPPERTALAIRVNDYKLETEFCGDSVVYPTYEQKPSTKLWRRKSWKRIKDIGSGAFGKVWLEKEEQGGQLRAVKKLSRDIRLMPDLSKKLLISIKSKDLGNHFVKFYGWHENNDSIYYAMEYIEHGHLSRYIRNTPEESKASARKISKQLLAGLTAMHGNGITHGDLKPQNILVASLNPIWVKIADFGTAKLDENAAMQAIISGTNNYIAPEICGLLPRKFRTQKLSYHSTYTFAADIWSLGCIMHTTLTSHTPFSIDEEYDTDSELGFEGLVSPQGIDRKYDTGSELELEDLSSGHCTDMFTLSDYCNGYTEFPSRTLEKSGVSEEGIAFAKRLLNPNPADRPSAARALHDIWLSETELPYLEMDIYKAPSLSMGTVIENYDNLFIERFSESPSAQLINSLNKGLHQVKKAEKSDKIKLLFDNKAEVNAHTNYQSVLQWATKTGYLTTFKLLLNAEIDASTSTDCLEALQTAAEGGYIDIVQLLINNKVNVNERMGKNGGRTALQAAAKSGHTDITKVLLDNKADANATAAGPEYGGRTALQAAAEGGYIDIVMLLLANKADVNATAEEYGGGRTALQAAAGGGHIEIVKLLLQNKANVNAAAAWENGRTALQAAAEGGHIETVMLLLDKKADVNATGAEYGGGRTALQAAAGGGHTDTVKLLLASGSNINGPPAKYGEGRTALQAAAEGGHLDTSILLLENRADADAIGSDYGGGRTALQLAAGGGHTDIFKLLLSSGADVNSAAADYGEGRTALQAASEGGHIEIVKLLLDNGADVNADAAKYGEGRTALQAAAAGGHIDVVKLLLDNKADVNAAPVGYYGGRTALQAAAEGGHTDIVKVLLERNAAVNDGPSKNGGRTAVQAAASGGHIDIVNLLLSHKADVNAAAGARRGRTALQAAAGAGHTSILQLLLDNNADVNAAGAEYGGGRTAIQAAAERGYTNIVKLLLDKNANVNAVEEFSDRTALRTVVDGRNTEIRKVLGDTRHLVSVIGL